MSNDECSVLVICLVQVCWLCDEVLCVVLIQFLLRIEVSYSGVNQHKFLSRHHHFEERFLRNLIYILYDILTLFIVKLQELLHRT